jgi:hypothetical protein
MRKILLILISFLACQSLVFAQHQALNHQQLTGEVFNVNYSIYKGSPYLFEGFTKGQIHFTNGETLAVDRMNYNVHLKMLVVYHPVISKLVSVDPQTVDRFAINGRDFKRINIKNSPEFVEVLYENSLTLYTSFTSFIITAENNAHEKHVMGRIKNKASHAVLLPNGESKTVKLRKRSLASIAPESKKEMLLYMRKNKLSLRNPFHVKKVMKQLEGLLL